MPLCKKHIKSDDGLSTSEALPRKWLQFNMLVVRMSFANVDLLNHF